MTRIALLDPAGEHVADAVVSPGQVAGAAVVRGMRGRLYFAVPGSDGLTFQELEERQIPQVAEIWLRPDPVPTQRAAGGCSVCGTVCGAGLGEVCRGKRPLSPPPPPPPPTGGRR